jgi:hypothetical protein
MAGVGDTVGGMRGCPLAGGVWWRAGEGFGVLPRMLSRAVWVVQFGSWSLLWVIDRGVLRILVRVLAVLFAVACVFLMFDGSRAGAVVVHKYESQLMGPSLGEPFVQPWGLTFDKEGSLYVGDAEGLAVDVFSSLDSFTAQVGRGSGPEKFNFPEEFVRSVAVSDATGDVYVAESGAENVDVFKSAGGGKYELLQEKKFGGFMYVAVDNSSGERGGDVYVWSSSPAVHVIKPNGEGRLEEAGTEIPPPKYGFSCVGSGGVSHTCKSGLTVDSATGRVYVANPVNKVVNEYNDKGELLVNSEGEPVVLTRAGSFEPVAVAVDALKGEVYVVDAANKVVDEFDSEGKYLGQITTTEAKEPKEPFGEPLGVAVSVTGHVYVSDAGKKVVDVFGADILESEPKPVTQPASSVETTSATLNGTVNPEGEEAKYYFEYGPCETSSTCSAAPYPSKTPEGVVGSSGETTPVSVPTAVEGLSPRTSYHVRLVASNKTTPRVPGAEVVFTTSGPPIINEAFPTGVSTNAATLNAEVNPEGLPGQWLTGTYFFQYGTNGVTEHTTPVETIPLVPAVIKEGKVIEPAHPGPITAPTTIDELELDTEYYYRIVVTDQDGTVQGEDHTFTTNPTTGSALPDDRAYEMVTPPNNQNANVYIPTTVGLSDENGIPTNLPFQASADGSAVAYVGDPSSEGNGNDAQGGGNEYLARRTGSGKWEQHDIQPPGYKTPIYQAFSTNLSTGILSSCDEDRPPLALGAPGGGYQVLYTHDNSGGAYHALFTSAPRSQSPGEFGAYGINSYSEKCSNTNDQVYAPAYAGASTDLSHLLLEANGALTPQAVGGRNTNNLYDSVAGQPRLVNVMPDGVVAPNATFGASTKILYQIPNLSHVISSDGSRIFWTNLNVSVGDPGDLYMRVKDETTVLISQDARFWTASTDGSKVFFTRGDLYEYDTNNATTTDLTPGVGVQGVIGASEDGEYVYFVAGDDGLYLYHAGTLTFITRLAPTDFAQIPPYTKGNEVEGGDLPLGLGNRTAEVTPDGHSVVFMSRLSLTGYDNKDMSEVYIYDTRAGRLFCVSCNPSGEPPQEVESEAAGFLPISHSNTYLQRWVSADGSRVFFDSTQPLVAQDTNGLQDVYEWEREKAGSCPEGSPGGGCVYLLSGGTSSSDSWLLEPSSSGDDVFIITRARLLPQDQNENYDVYDVRVGGVGSPVEPECSGTGCQGVSPASAIFATPASVTLADIGNWAPGAQVLTEPVTKPRRSSIDTQRLMRALKACRALRVGHKRAGCEALARRRYGSKSKAKTGARKNTKARTSADGGGRRR